MTDARGDLAALKGLRNSSSIAEPGLVARDTRRNDYA